MRIAILTAGRFHVLDLARELAALGHDVRFYSILPRRHTRAFGLPDACYRWLGPVPTAAAVLYRGLAGRVAPHRARRLGVLASQAVDRAGARVIEPCDVLIGMSGMSLRAMRRVKRRDGAVTVCERSSQHILAQRDILDAMPGREAGGHDAIPAATVAHELAQYREADLISVPSGHVVESFVARGVARDRVFKNPLGTDIAMFRPTAAPPADRRRVIMAGNWSLQKGCDVLVDAWRRLDALRPTELVHVGATSDAATPTGAARFTDVGHVPQAELPAHYGAANVFALPSRQDGFGVVISQALACGLRVVCSDRTGGPDVAELLDDPSVVSVVPAGDAEALAEALDAALDAARGDGPTRDLLGDARERLSWAGYARRWDARLRAL